MKRKFLMMSLIVGSVLSLPALALDDAAKTRLAAVSQLSGYDAVLAPLAPADLAAAMVYLLDVKKLPLADVCVIASAAIGKKPAADQPKYVAAVKSAIVGFDIDATGKLVVSGSAGSAGAMAGPAAKPAASPFSETTYGAWITRLRTGDGTGPIFDNPKGVSRP
jgi:hypothetical protein